jgi:endonuclease/exonuclease/phosphatase family metal-dependent hydrolase
MRNILRIIAALNLLMACGCATGTGGGSKPMTVLTYNVHHGAGTDGKLDLGRIAKIIREQKPDLVAVQEVDEKATRSGGVAQAEELGRLTGMHAVFGKAMDFQGGGYGQAVLSKWPISKHEVRALPQKAGREPRIMLEARIDIPGEDLVFASVHLDHEVEEIRLGQADEINRLFKGRSLPAIVAGDFNAGPESGTMKAMMAEWVDTAGGSAGFTIPAGSPRRRIDYILAAPQGRWKIVRSEVLNEPVASDHRPVVARIELLD